MQFTKENAYVLAEEFKTKYNPDRELLNHKTIVNDFIDFLQTRDMFAKPHTGRPKTLDKAKQVAILKSAASGTTIKYSRFMLEQMVDLGLLEKVKRSETTGRGRKPVCYVPTGKGKSYISLSKNWGL